MRPIHPLGKSSETPKVEPTLEPETVSPDVAPTHRPPPSATAPTTASNTMPIVRITFSTRTNLAEVHSSRRGTFPHAGPRHRVATRPAVHAESRFVTGSRGLSRSFW